MADHSPPQPATSPPPQPSAAAWPANNVVGEPVAVVSHGVEESPAQGQPAPFYAKHTCPLAFQVCCLWPCICGWWPVSGCVFLSIFMGNFLTRQCEGVCPAECCFAPHQNVMHHSLFVMLHVLQKYWCCCCCIFQRCLSHQPGVLFITAFLPEPPNFIFDEDEKTPVLLTFDDYCKKKKSTFPPHSGRYRAIDGGGNSEIYPFMGQGGRGYAMTEPFQNLSVLPDPVAMTAALQRRTKFIPAPNGMNSLPCWFANVAIHDFFRSATGQDSKRFTGGVEKPWVNLHSGYLDCQPLYGFNEEIARGTRSFVGGKLSKIAEDRFDRRKIWESKIILELLRREHNYICDELASRYPTEFDTDEKLYQQARLINCGVYINVIQRQYGDQVFGENGPDGKGAVELRHNYSGLGSLGIRDSKRTGASSTFAFNLIYRWHASLPEYFTVRQRPDEPKTDEDIKAILVSMLGERSGAFGPYNTPVDLVDPPMAAEAAAIRWGREVGAPRLNDFRRRCLLAPPYTNFFEMTGDEETAKILEKFYPTVEDVELSIGVQVEQCYPGGWCLPASTSLTVTADAFSSIRQDRFYTDDFNSKNYTPWGYEHATTTNLADIVNRHLGMNIDRTAMLSRLPTWKPAKWSELKPGFTTTVAFDVRGTPIPK